MSVAVFVVVFFFTIIAIFSFLFRSVCLVMPKFRERKITYWIFSPISSKSQYLSYVCRRLRFFFRCHTFCLIFRPPSLHVSSLAREGVHSRNGFSGQATHWVSGLLLPFSQAEALIDAFAFITEAEGISSWLPSATHFGSRIHSVLLNRHCSAA